jgi:hypothetical protein
VVDLPVTLGPAAPWAAPELTHDFALRLLLPQVEELWQTGARLAVQIGRNITNRVVLDRDESGRVGLQVETVEGIACVPRFVAAAPAGPSMRVEVVAKGLWLVVRANGVDVFDGPVDRWGGRFRPIVRVLGESDPIEATVVSFAVSRPLPFMPQATDRELFGVSGGPQGGNGINHPSSRLVAAVYLPVIEAADFDVAAVPDPIGR